MIGQADINLSAPSRLVRGGVALAALCASFCLVQPATAQVRLHGDSGSYSVSVVSWRDIPFRTVVRQQYDYSCGSAAVATLLRFHYGVSINEGEVFQSMYQRGDQARIRQVGFSMLDMRAYLETRGFRADGLRLSLDRLAELEVPAIALITHDNYRHFVVVKGISEDRVLVGDPTYGLQTFSRAEFQEVWNGVVLAIRQPPQGWPAAAYNRAEEWRPWAVAPVSQVRQPTTPTELTLTFGELYQISPATPPIPTAPDS